MLYSQIANQIEEMIQKGALRPGERIPSVRNLSQQRKVSVSTVLQAYLVLENKGLIESRPQSGYYVKPQPFQLAPEPRISSPATSACRIGVGDLIRRFFEAERDPAAVSFASATAGPELYPTAALNRMITATAKKLGPAAHLYEMPPGDPALRRLISKRSLELGCAIPPDEITITSGGLEALHLCLRAVTKPGDIVAIESPTYYGILQAMEMLQIKALEIPTHPRDGISIDGLKSAIRRHPVKAVLVMPSFHNPLGSCMPDEAKKELVELLGRHEIPLIEDDVYGELSFASRRPRPAKSYDRKGLVLMCSSFSKTLSPGLRVGWAAPGRFAEPVRTLKFMNTIATGTLAQATIAGFLENGGYDRHLRKLRSAFAGQVDTAKQLICGHFPEGTKVTRPSGGFVLWVELPERLDALCLYDRSMEEKISFAPGCIFSPKQKLRNFIRINCGNVFDERRRRALIRLGELARESR